MNSSQKYNVCLFAEPNFLSVNILENLLSNNCYVVIVTEDLRSWERKTTNIVYKNRFCIRSLNSGSINQDYNYVIFCDGFLNRLSLSSHFNNFLRNINTVNSKTLIIFPREIYGVLNTDLVNLSENAGVIYVGDLLGPRIDLSADLIITNYLSNILSSKSLSVPVGEVLYPLFVSDAARQLVKWLFAFGPFGKASYLLGAEVSSTTFWQVNTKLVGDINYFIDRNSLPNKIHREINNVRINKDLGYQLTETFRWIKNNQEEILQEKKLAKINILPLPVISKKTKNSKKSTGPLSIKTKKFLLASILIIFVYPLFSIILNTAILYSSTILYKKGNDRISLNLLNINSFTSKISIIESGGLKHIPILGYPYKETEYASLVLNQASIIEQKAIPLSRKVGNLVKNILGENPYLPNTELEELSGQLKNIYAYTQKVNAYTKVGIEENLILAKFVNSKININNYEKLLSQLVLISDNLPSILGLDSSKTYLVLFQNNMELRPTGGFIGSYGLLTFDKGKLSDLTISDVYSADGQLNGHVEPPAPIKNYLGEANWWLRDSNWDPDFPTSAKRAEWFLDKEIGREVDGVFAVDLYPIRDFLKINGPVYLPDYSLNINADNLYEKVQSEVQNNSFPGTYQKSSFLTALSRSILNDIGDPKKQIDLQFIKEVYKSLNTRHIQIFIHNSDTQRALSNLAWDGSVYTPTCDKNCYTDIAGVVEANVGVNKANYFIKRSIDTTVDLSGQNAVKNLTLTLINSANINLGQSGKYKAYIRLLVPESTNNISVKSIYGQNEETLTPEITDAKGRKEVGVLFEVLPGETKKLTYVWSNNIDAGVRNYNLFIRKQAGVDDFPVKVSIETQMNILSSNPTFTLTNTGNYVYNTTLARDLFSKFNY